jgi:hypothetical protein
MKRSASIFILPRETKIIEQFPCALRELRDKKSLEKANKSLLRLILSVKKIFKRVGVPVAYNGKETTIFRK